MITENYIKMCEDEDLQELWEPCEGSWVKRIDFKKPYVLDYDADRTICYAFDCNWIKQVNPNPEILKWYDQRGENYVLWLPTQEQLQEILDNQLVSLDGEISRMATIFLISNDQISWNEFWLMYVMYKKWNKLWNGEEWVKEGNDVSKLR
jgi:hypothetical protein